MRIQSVALPAAAFAASMLALSAARADTAPLGLWIDHTGRGAVEIKQCGNKLCGHVAWLKDAKNADACGEQILGDVASVGGGKWDHGWIYDPDREERYDVELTPVGSDTLRVVGYAGTKWLSETMTWKRAPADLQKCSKTEASAPAKDKPAVAEAPAKTEPKAELKEANTPPGKPEAEERSAARDAAPGQNKADEAKPGDRANIAKAPDAEARARDDDEDEDEPRGRKRGEAIAKIAEALNVRKIGRGNCKMDVPYVDMVVTFPCEDR